jgi:ProP effector
VLANQFRQTGAVLSFGSTFSPPIFLSMDTSPPSSPPSSPAAPNPVQAARALLNEIQERFPVFRECKPLAIGIDKQVIAQMPEVNRKSLRIALSLHTKSLRYQKAMEKATSRFNLDGTPAGDIDEAHRQRASEIVRERIKQSIDQKKARAKAEKVKAEEEKAERRRAEKLQQLTEKFSPRR